MKSKRFGSSETQATAALECGKLADPAKRSMSGCGKTTCRAGIFFTGLALGMLGIAFVSGCTGGVLSENADVRESSLDASLAGTPAHEEAVSTGGAEAAASTRPEPVWQDTFEQAVAHAAENELPVLLRFSAAWCSPCRVMDATAWPDEQVKATLANSAVPVKIDIDEQANAAVVRRYGIRSIPAILLIDANGDELARGGFMSPEQLVEFLSQS